MKKIYFDNASATPLRKEVYKTYLRTLKDFGNPSSDHSLGLVTKAKIEAARREISYLLNVTEEEIIFTSSGTEANNLILRNCLSTYKIQYIITSEIEHKSVINTIYDLFIKYNVLIHFVKINANGEVNLKDLRSKLKANRKMRTLVSLMYVNNEVGNILKIKKVQKLCKRYKAYFHSDMTQTIGMLKINLKKLKVHFASFTAHKFYGPSGIGFAYVKKSINITPLITGGSQERGRRAGTENIYGIVGMSKALQLAYKYQELDSKYIKKLKKYCVSQLSANISKIRFNGLSKNFNKSSHHIINFSIPRVPFVHIYLDQRGIIISNGSSCYSSVEYSHVMTTLYKDDDIQKYSFIRVSFGYHNTMKQIDKFIDQLKAVIKISTKIKRLKEKANKDLYLSLESKG